MIAVYERMKGNGFLIYTATPVTAQPFFSLSRAHTHACAVVVVDIFYIYRVIVYINWVIVNINMSETPNLSRKSQLKIVYVYINSVFVDINYSYCIFDVN